MNDKGARTMPKNLCRSAFFVLVLVPASFAGNAESRLLTPPVAKDDQAAVLVGAGDIADCKNLVGAEATAKLLDLIPGTVMAVGDLAYPDGSTENFTCYDKTWGRARSRTRSALGNHEFHAAGATPYFDYFGVAAGDPKTGYYSYELGPWHIIVLNSECKDVGGCDSGSPQERWLRADLAAHPVACTVAYWHKPLFSSGSAHGNDLTVKALWDALYDANADVVITLDSARGIREFVVGTGGKGLRPFGAPKPNSEVRNTEAFGVLKLTLHAKGYDWQFVPEEGKTYGDSGSGVCH